MPSSNRFTPAKESPLFIKLFDIYCKVLFWRRFRSVNVDLNYDPQSSRKTIYYLNHNSWWDGLIPFYLNQNYFQQNARGIMEDKQLEKYSFFSRLGVFSINLDNPRSSIHSLRYAIESMDRPKSSLYMYPQGKIVPFTVDKLNFKKGIGWLCKQLPEVDVVPVAIHIHTMYDDKPKLNISVGSAVKITHLANTNEIKQLLEERLSSLLTTLVEES
ncbi:MAG: lysophospholipid acyltransferase family protein, partial [Balneolaceae bacterium]